MRKETTERHGGMDKRRLHYMTLNGQPQHRYSRPASTALSFLVIVHNGGNSST